MAEQSIAEWLRDESLEDRVRKMAHSLPPSDLGSTRAIQAIARFVEDELDRLTKEGDAARLGRDILRQQLRDAGIEPLVTEGANG